MLHTKKTIYTQKIIYGENMYTHLFMEKRRRTVEVCVCQETAHGFHPISQHVKLSRGDIDSRASDVLGYSSGGHRGIKHAHLAARNEGDKLVFHVPSLGTKFCTSNISARHCTRDFVWPDCRVPKEEPRPQRQVTRVAQCKERASPKKHHQQTCSFPKTRNTSFSFSDVG